MKLKIYTATKGGLSERAVRYTEEYFKKEGLPIELSPVDRTVIDYKDESIYSFDWSWSLSKMTYIKSVKTEVIQRLPHEGYDGVILFVDKSKGREDHNLFGQHRRVNNKSYIEVYESNRWYKPTKGGEGYSRNKIGAVRGQVEHTLIHEIFHAFAWHIGVPDNLHNFIEGGNFETYAHYLKSNIKIMTPNAQKLYDIALQSVGVDATPKDEVPDEVACASTVSTLLGKVIDFPHITGTWTLNDRLKKDARFERIDTIEKGAILVYPTGTGNGNVSNGHIFICGEGNLLYSNSSHNGLFQQNFTLESARRYYRDKGGFQECIYKLK